MLNDPQSHLCLLLMFSNKFLVEHFKLLIEHKLNFQWYHFTYFQSTDEPALGNPTVADITMILRLIKYFHVINNWENKFLKELLQFLNKVSFKILKKTL